MPVLQLEGREIGDSTEIIAALEDRYPEPPLYPVDPEERARALELEDWFDEKLGPHARLLALLRADPGAAVFAEVAAQAVPGPLGKAKPVSAPTPAPTPASAGANSGEDAARAREKIVAAFDKLEAELEKGEGEFLVGDSLSVADVTAASLFYPVVGPARARSRRTCPPPGASSASARGSPTAAAIVGRGDLPPAPQAGRGPRRRTRLARLNPRSAPAGWRPRRSAVPSMPRMWTATMLKTIDFAVAVPTPTGPPAGGVAVVAADQHDHGRHRHPLDQAEDEVGRVLEHPEDQFVAARGDVGDLVDHGEEGGRGT